MSLPITRPHDAARPATAPVLSVEDLRVRYRNGFEALRGIDLSVTPGERVGVVGPSGCGKTTLIRAILGILPPATTVTGRIDLQGQPLLGAPPRRLREVRGLRIGYVAQDPYAACDPLQRVRRHVEEAWTAHRRRPPVGVVATGLSRMGIDDAARRMQEYPHQWSGGMLQRATTLAATVHGPALMLADEPTSALDADLADEAMMLLGGAGSAVILVSHDLALVARHTDRVLVLDRGVVVEQAPATRVMTHPADPVTAALVAASAPTPRRAATATAAGDSAVLDQPVLDQPVVEAPVVEATGLVRAYRGPDHTPLTVLAGVDLTVRPGEVVGIVGPSGSGKSTLLRLVAGLERPDAGTLRLGGRPVWNGRTTASLPRRGYVMPVFQDPVASLDPRWSLWRTVTEPLRLAGEDGPLRRARRRTLAREALARVGLEEVDVDRLPGSLSVGQCQRVAIARALIAHPALLLADEPTASLDVEAAAAAANVLRAAADAGTAVLVVSHDVVRLRSYADRVLTMSDGHLA